MRLKKIRFTNYGVLENKEFEFKENPFLFVAPNESGKTTLVQGIIDTFKFSPKDLKKRITAGKDIEPVITLEFEIGGVEYELKVNAQENRLSLKGKDGTELSSGSVIKKFFGKKGYNFISSVVENLLIIREKEISRTDVKSGLKELFDSVLGLEAIRKVKTWLDEEFLRKQEGAYFLKRTSLGYKEEEIRKGLERVSKELEEKKKELENYEKDKEEHEKISKELEKKKKEKTKLENQLEKKKRIFLLAKKEKLEKEIGKLKDEYKQKKNKKEELEKEIQNKKDNLDKIRKELSKKGQERVRYEEQIKNLPVKRKELEKVDQKIKDFKKIKELEENLGNFKNISSENLYQDLYEWQNYEKLLENFSQGIIRIKQAEEEVKVIVENEEKSFFAEEEVIFKGKAEVKYKDLAMEVFPTIELKEIEKKVAELKKTYGDLENLKILHERAKERENLLAKYSGEEMKDLENLAEKKKAVEEEIKKLEGLEKRIKNFEKTIESFKKEEKELEDKINDLNGKDKQVATAIGGIEKEIEQKKKEKESLEEELKEMKFTLEEIEKAKEEAENLEKLEKEIKELEEEAKKVSEEVKELEIKESEYRGRLEKVPDKEKVEDLYLEKKKLEEKLSKLKMIREVLFYSREIMNELSQRLQEKWLKEFEKKASFYFAKITGGKYKNVCFSAGNLFFKHDEFEKKWEAERADGTIFPIDKLSDGTKIQLLLSARLALIQCFYKSKAFLIFDEAFAYFDKERERNTLDILNHLAKEGWQIIILRCKEYAMNNF